MQYDFKHAYEYYARIMKNAEQDVPTVQGRLTKVYEELKANGFSVTNNSGNEFQFTALQRIFFMRIGYNLVQADNYAGGKTAKLDPEFTLFERVSNNEGGYKDLVVLKYVKDGSFYKNQKDTQIRFEPDNLAPFFLFDFFRTLGINVKDPSEFI